MNFSLKTSLQCIELTQLLCAINHTTEILQRRLLVLQIWARSTIPRRFYNEDYWFSKYGHGQPYHGGFTMKITDSSNMGTVNHATENLQHRILDFSKYCSVITRLQRERYRARRERGTEVVSRARPFFLNARRRRTKKRVW